MQTDKFILYINGIAFQSYPYQAEFTPTGPQNIDSGRIMLNGETVHVGFEQFTIETVQDWRYDHNLSPTNDLYIGWDESFNWFTCSSAEVLNSLLDELSLCIDPINGLKKLTIECFRDKENALADWPLSQLLIKSPHLEELTMRALFTTPANTSQLLEFTGNVATNSNCMHKLTI